ncbi:cell cycle checkpoint [Coniophora puteana RWD-64-598 SS2]|uniref:Checkpoint protein n=1 Tax=Coniophora puteana (strain RWD-64-598) TaxID=741705 RepID=A0A5M3MX20_CONPW|nr:cell cycle checkpoint [Coniophora puteana RWD-64-598 SS2]EIW83682.1 cell cycle checkpoint [Coniophora puteana RWD-64-598 SS2]
MRFRANIENVPIFYRTIQAVEKLQKKCIIKFTETEMHIICNDDANEGGIQVWSVVKVDSIFASYRIQSNANNQITMILATDALLQALRSSSTSAATSSVAAAVLPTYDSDEVVMKLAKKHDQAVLAFEMLGISRTGRKIRVAHDVRVDVMRPSDVDRLREPLCPEPDVHILLPNLQKLRTIVERIRPLSDIIAIRANNSGKLQVSIDTDTVKLETQWTGCANPPMARDELTQDAEDPAHEHDPDELFSVHVSIRSFLKFLNSHVVSTTTIACVCQNHCAILYVYIGEVADAGGVLTYYIPTVIDGDE